MTRGGVASVRLTFRPYAPADAEACLALFDANVPRYFDASERAEFAAFLAAAARSPAAAENVRAALEAFSAAGPEEAVEADFAFHRSIAAATGNRFYLDLLDSLGPMMIMLPRTRLPDEFSLTDAAHVERVHREHDNVAAAVLAGDPETARAAMRVHLGNTRRRLQS